MRLRKWFRPSKEEVWRQLSGEINAEFVAGSFWKGAKVQAAHRDWTVTLDTHTASTGKSHIVYTRMRAPYVNPDGFRFTVYRRGMFSAVAKRFGMQDIPVGHDDFDEAFIVKGTDEDRVKTLFQNERLRELLFRQPKVQFTVKNDEGLFGPKFPEGVDELQFMVIGVIKDVEQLKALYELFAVTLDELCRLGSAYDARPDVAL